MTERPDPPAPPGVLGADDGGAFYDEPDVLARYCEHRSDARHLDPNTVMEEPAVLREIGDPSGLRILDLGCGDGGFGAALLAAGARSYLGIDASRRMIERAQQGLAGTAGRAVRQRIEDVVSAPGSFDLATARLSLHYVADIDRIVRVVAESLVAGGRLVFSVVHPVITSHDNQPRGPRTTWTVDGYFHRGPRVRAWLGSRVTWQHRTVEDYVRAVTAAGLTLTTLCECAPDPARFDGHPDELARRRRVPLFLLITARA